MPIRHQQTLLVNKKSGSHIFTDDVRDISGLALLEETVGALQEANGEPILVDQVVQGRPADT